MDDHIGWREQGDGKFYYGLNIENGRLYDDDKIQFKAALREICSTLAPPLRLTAHQSILFIDCGLRTRTPLLGILRKHHVPLSQDISTVRRGRWPAWPSRRAGWQSPKASVRSRG